MPDNGSAPSASARPYPMFAFRVSWDDGATMFFQEVSGLGIDTQTADYRGASRPAEATIKRPSLRKPASLTFKRGVFARDGALPSWIAPGKPKLIKRATVTIELVDAKGTPRKRWKLTNAFPAKIVGPDLNATGNDVAIESIEIAHEGLTLIDT